MNSTLLETQIAIKYIKDNFERLLAKKLNLTRVSAPLFVEKSTGLNDDLSGVEESVNFTLDGKRIEIVHSLAKWKRNALREYGFAPYTGLYTDMNAIRKDEHLDRLHSIYVDQWDWEKVILRKDRNKEYLFQTVKEIYSVIKKLANMAREKWSHTYFLPKSIFVISSSELEALYPTLSTKEREREITKKHGAVFLYQIGWPLPSGVAHDARAADYDDWKLNGDILLYDEVIEDSLEISSMGIRVDGHSLREQLEFKGELSKLDNPYCKAVTSGVLPLTIGGGIGQSRLCMYFLKKRHIGEVQSSYWPKEMKDALIAEGLEIL
ncbi:MAG: aspartate--ammonia ligase [Bacilli bacterium]|nr:aspartate--ammonia ligase [Bacilli bacterium]